MYYYYYLAERGVFVWWKKYITKVQIVQFIFDIVTHFMWYYYAKIAVYGCSGVEWVCFYYYCCCCVLLLHVVISLLLAIIIVCCCLLLHYWNSCYCCVYYYFYYSCFCTYHNIIIGIPLCKFCDILFLVVVYQVLLWCI